MKNKVLVVVAHPDDEVLGMGGTIYNHTKNGDELHLLIVTDGSSSQYRNSDELSQIIAQKKMATDKASQLLGIKSVMYGNLPDMKLDTLAHITINEVVEKAIDLIKPNIVYTHFWGDLNLDHQLVCKSVMVATRPSPTQCVKRVICFNVPSSTEWNIANTKNAFLPNYFVEITKYAKIKYEAMNCYSMELREYPHPRSIESIKILDKSQGIKQGCGPAESFVVIRDLKGE